MEPSENPGRFTTERALASDKLATGGPTLARVIGQNVVDRVREWLRLASEAVKSSSTPVGRDEPLTDVGNARRLLARCGSNIRYVPHWKSWLMWDGQRWQKDSMNRIAHLAKDTIRALYLDAANAPGWESQDLAKHAIRSEAAGRIAAMVQLAQSDPSVVVAPEVLDADLFRLTVFNGTIDLRSGVLQPHRREDLMTKLAPVTHDPTADCPQWLEMLDRIMAGDAAQIGFLQKALGYALTGDASEQCFFILHGRGANGKSTVIEVIRAVMGDYAMATAPETLLVKATSGGANNDIAMLQGARFVSAVETDQGRRIAEALVKQTTGGDRITARFLYGEFFEFPPSFKLFLATNHKPVIRGTDHAIWQRVRLIPFEVQIPEKDQDRHLASKIKAAELPGILNWLIEGCRAWQTDGLTPPERVLAATAEYREEQDVLGRFLGDACEESPAAVTLARIFMPPTSSGARTWASAP
jgi:putative DNA primase/helicase